MARVVLIIDSATGTMVDATGRGREGARYKRLAKRMLSLGKPTTVLDYGGNGATKLEVSNGGVAGDEISLKAATVNISTTDPSTPAVLKINGLTLAEIIASGGSGDSVLNKIVGKDGEISVTFIQDPAHPSDPSAQLLQISLDQTVAGKIDTIDQAIDDLSADGFVRKEDIARVIQDISFDDDYTLDDVKGMLRVLVQRLSDLAGVDSGSDSSSSS